MSTKRKGSILSIKDKPPFILWLAKETNLSTEKGVSEQKIFDIRKNKERSLSFERSHWYWYFRFLPGVLSIWLEFSVIPGRIQMERFIPVECFRKKGSTFRGIPFFSLLLVYCSIWRKILTSFSSPMESASVLSIIRTIQPSSHASG